MELRSRPRPESDIVLRDGSTVHVTPLRPVDEEALVSSADTALRLARLLGTSAEFWLNLQNASDLHRAAEVLARAEA